MSTVTELEHEILTLPDQDFHSLLAWMKKQHLDRLAASGYEAPELEAAILRGLDSPGKEWNDQARARVRAGWR